MTDMASMHWFGSAMVGNAAHDGQSWEIVQTAAGWIDERGLVTVGV